MTQQKFEKWEQENSTHTEKAYINRLDYVFCTLKDGWIGVFQQEDTGYTPIIKAADLDHARSYCSMLEPVSVPFNVI